MASKFIHALAILGLAAGVALSIPSPANAQVRRGAVARAPRAVAVAPRFVRPPIGAISPYRPYYYRPGVRFGFGFGFGYPYYPFYDYGYGYYPYAYAPYGYPYGYATGAAYGGVRVQFHDRNAQVYVDGYYAGIVDNFDGVFQHLDLPAGPHHIEVRPQGATPLAFDVNVQPGQTITYRPDPNAPHQ